MVKDPTVLPANTYKLTRKQKRFADLLLNNPKLSAAQAVREVYNITRPDSSTPRTVAAENLAKPNIQLYMDAHVQKAKNKIIQLIDSKADKIALAASDSVLNRALGKPTQRVEQHTTSVSLELALADLTAMTPVNQPEATPEASASEVIGQER